MRARRPVAAGLLSLLVGCSSHAGGNLDFKAPQGWISTPAVFGMQKVQNPTDRSESILIAHPSEPRPKSHPATERWTAIRICGNHPAMFMQQRGSINGDDVQMDGVDTTWNGSRVMAMYARPFGKPADPEAEQAIRSLCVAN